MIRHAGAAAALILTLSAPASAQTLNQTSGPWVLEKSGTTAGLRGIHAVGGGIAWASGTNGTVLRTEDGGYEWQSCAMPPGAEKLDFRGVWAWDDNTAIVMSSGPGDQSRLYKTTDGCSSWKLLLTNPDKDGFWDAMVFWSKQDGLILGDPVEETRFRDPAYEGSYWRGKHFVLLQTTDGGATWKWKYTGRGEIPAAGPRGSGAFAASNSALAMEFPWAWFGTGGASGAFVFTGHDIPGDAGPPFESQGFAWLKQAPVPLGRHSDSSGVFSLAFRPEPKMRYDARIAADNRDWWIPKIGVAVGGDYTKPDDPTGTAAWTSDGGGYWTAASKPPHGYRSTVAWDADAKAWIAAGPDGSDISRDDGRTWATLDNGDWNALSLPWVVGPHGRIAKLDPDRLQSGKRAKSGEPRR